MPGALLTTLGNAIQEANDPVRLRYAAKGLFAGLLTFCVLAFLAMQMGTAQGRNLLLIISFAAGFAVQGVFVLGLAHLTAGERSCSKESSPLTAALSNPSAAVGAPALFAGVLVMGLFVEIVLFQLGKVEAFGAIVVALLFVPAVILNALLLLSLAAAIWLGAAVAVGKGTAAGATFMAVAALLRVHARTVLPLYLAGFVATGLAMLAVWALASVALSLTLWAAQQAMPSYQLAMITGVPQLLMGATLGFGVGAGMSMQIANLTFLATAVAVLAAIGAYPVVLFSEVSMRICDAYGESIEGAIAASGSRTPEPTSRYCPQCHGEVGPHSAFCDSCGAKVGAPA